MNPEWTCNTRPARITVEAATSRPPGRGASWAAEFGRWRTVGKAESATVKALADGMAAFLADYRPPVIITYGGYTSIVSIDMHDGVPSWHEVVTGPNGYCSTTGSGDGWELAIARARHSLAQRVTDWHNDASVHAGAAFVADAAKVDRGQFGPEEFYRYAAWQRAAKDALDAGRDCWHDWASAYWRQFEVIRPNN